MNCGIIKNRLSVFSLLLIVVGCSSVKKVRVSSVDSDSQYYWLSESIAKSEKILNDSLTYNYNIVDMGKVDSLLKNCIGCDTNIIDDIKFSSLNIKDYNMQLIPMLSSKGESLLWVNGACSKYSSVDSLELVKVRDGGDCFFDLIINLTESKCSDIYVH